MFHSFVTPLYVGFLLAALVPVVLASMLALEHACPARAQPDVRGWAFKGSAFFVLGGAVAVLLPATIVAGIGELTPLSLESIGLGGALPAFLLADLVLYVEHRVVHNVRFLWRWTHQMHHSAERVDVAGAWYLHPIDLAVRVGVSVLVGGSLGVTDDAVALAAFLGVGTAAFQHLNVRTPPWIGWFIQRPEAHAVHHARGLHAYNYGSVSLWDIALGTFRNPATFTGPAGIADGASHDVGAMLLGRDVGDHGRRITPERSNAEER